MSATVDTDDPVLEETLHAFMRSYHNHRIKEVVAKPGAYRCRYWLPDNPGRDFRLGSIVSACAARRAKSGDTEWFASGDYHQARENALRCRELIVGGERQPMPKYHSCDYIAARSALVGEAEARAMKAVGAPDKRNGAAFTRRFNLEMDRLSAPLLCSSNNGAGEHKAS